jgi:neprilysin
VLFWAVTCESENNDDVCSTAICERESEDILAKLDENLAPCEDFYRFACGKYINETNIPDDKTSVDVATILDDKLKEQLNEILNSSITSDDINPFVYTKKLYRACMNEGD